MVEHLPELYLSVGMDWYHHIGNIETNAWEKQNPQGGVGWFQEVGNIVQLHPILSNSTLFYPTPPYPIQLHPMPRQSEMNSAKDFIVVDRSVIAELGEIWTKPEVETFFLGK